MLKILTTNINDYFYELMSDQISKDIHPMMLLSLLADKLKFYKNFVFRNSQEKKLIWYCYLDFTSHMWHTVENPVLINVQILFKCIKLGKLSILFFFACLLKLIKSLKSKFILSLILDLAVLANLPKIY